ncbi:hypothetical protein J6590_038589 [Homalodisca vitripennis]|nr:hypothetical protein J6590_038589 [Homalodisca vitripennis]
MLFINFFDDEVGSETTGSPNLKDAEIKPFSDEGLVNNFLPDVFNETSVYTANYSETAKSPIPTDLNHSENAMSVFFGDSGNEETETVKFESPSSDKTEPGMSAEGFDNSESCDNIPLQITRIYFKAIATLIQHIMDAIFAVNETPMNSRVGEAPMFEDDHFDSSPSRRLRKRDIPPGSELSSSTKQSEPDVQSSTHADHSSKNIHTHDSSEEQVSTPESSLTITKLLSQQDKIVRITSNVSKKIELPHVGVNSSTEINLKSVKSENKHESTLKNVHGETEQKSSTTTSTAHSSLASTSLKQSTSSPTEKPVNADEKKNIPKIDELVSNADLLKGDPAFLLYDQTSGEKQVCRSRNNQQQEANSVICCSH